MTITTRFAPSPTGFLHIGGARTALFNWLYAKHHGGKFHLRIEDTDRARSTQPAIDAIIESMKWLGLDWDGDVVYQFARTPRHAEVAHELVKKGKAFYCYTTQGELEEFRAKNPNAKFRSPYRDGSKAAPDGVPAVVRLKAPLDGETIVHDKVQGRVSVKNSELDDMVLLRSDGTPTYMLAVVVDDHDMGVTNIIRGDDHHTNSFRQFLIYHAMGWQVPEFAHIPLIHGADGAKLSKRHGALGVGEYEKMGYLPEAVRNYLLRLGWSHGDDEIISTKQAIEWFDLNAVGKSPSRFDFAKLENLNGHYMREADDARLVELIKPFLRIQLSSLRGGEADVAIQKSQDFKKDGLLPATPTACSRNDEFKIKDRLALHSTLLGVNDYILLRSMNGLKQRAKTIVELADNAAFYVANRPIKLDEKAQAVIEKGGREIIVGILPKLENLPDWNHVELEKICREYSEEISQKLGNIAQPLRCAIAGKTTSPSMFEVMEILGKEEIVGRLKDTIK